MARTRSAEAAIEIRPPASRLLLEDPKIKQFNFRAAAAEELVVSATYPMVNGRCIFRKGSFLGSSCRGTGHSRALEIFELDHTAIARSRS
jgi:hypothetical protein